MIRRIQFNTEDFDAIRPYYDSEINSAMKRITKSPVFEKIAEYLFPEKSIDELISIFHNIHSADEFQDKFMDAAVWKVVEKTSNGLTFNGFDKLDSKSAYLFISNHRDIVLDSAILQIILRYHKLPTSEITFGSNLMTSPFVVDFGKANKMFTVFRGGSKIEFLNNSKLLSSYIRYTINEKKKSVWIAQRNGRTKNGNDQTEEALLKMFNLSGHKHFIENFIELNIVPLSISYEIEPCAIFKVKELYESIEKEYIKTPGEDVNSIITGITKAKGRIHLSAGKILNNDLQHFSTTKSYNENINNLKHIIDHEIYKNYKLWPSNYIALDMLSDENIYSSKYTKEEKEKFIQSMKSKLRKLHGDKNVMKEIYLKIYALPLLNTFNDGVIFKEN